MVQAVESRIHKLLLEHGDSLKVADILLRDWDSGGLAWVEQNAVGHFLIKCGYLRAFMDQVTKNLKQGQRIPWSSFLEALSLSKTQFSREDFDQIFVGAAEEQALKDLVSCVRFDDKDPRFEKIRHSLDNSIIRSEVSAKERPQPPKDISGETRTVQNSPPTTKKIGDITVPQFEEEGTPSFVKKIEHRNQKKDNELKTQVKKLFEKALKNKPDGRKEAAIALAMMGAWEEGLQVLSKMPQSPNRDFLELHFFLEAGKNIEVLELSSRLLETPLNLDQKSYVQFRQAQALIHLRKTNDAYIVLENLLTDDPNHFAADALMKQIRTRTK